MGDMIALLVMALFDVGCYVLAGVFLQGKGASLIAGYNTATEAEQQQYDEKKLCRGAGGVALAVGVGLTVMTLGIALAEVWKILPEWVTIAVGIMFTAVTLCAVIWYLRYANTRCKRQKKQEEMK